MENLDIIVHFSLILFLVSNCVTLFEGDYCVLLSGEGGKCTIITNCDYAKKLLDSNKIQPEQCGFNRNSVLVCCPVSSRKLERVKSKSQRKCEEYNYIRRIGPEVAHGSPAQPKEFSHMAALGYGNIISTVKWLCGGSLISDCYILTAAHCLTTLEFGDVKWVRLGDVDLKDTADDAHARNVKVLRSFAHPDYKSSSHYNDIALLELHESVRFNSFIRPACIHTEKDLDSKVQAIGWGRTEFLGEASSHLMKVYMNVIEHKSCAKTYSVQTSKKLVRGIDNETQICAGDSVGSDTCPGDSGGPLQIKVEGSGSMLSYYDVVGITSFGRGCGFENSTGVYTRVSFYQSWIENVVWS